VCAPSPDDSCRALRILRGGREGCDLLRFDGEYEHAVAVKCVQIFENKTRNILRVCFTRAYAMCRYITARPSVEIIFETPRSIIAFERRAL
jgi:hypothetical protein